MINSNPTHAIRGSYVENFHTNCADKKSRGLRDHDT